MSLSSNQYSKDDNNKGKTSVTVYSDYSFANPDSTVDKSRLSVSFCLGLLKLTINPKNENSKEQYTTYDKEGGTSIYLSHTKALLLLDDMEAWEKNPTMANSIGVDSGTGNKQGLIQISNGQEFGVNSKCVVIRKLAQDEDGNPYVSASFAYQMKDDDYHYSVRNFNPDTLDFDRVYHNDIEYRQFKTLLREYVKAQTGAISYNMMEQMKYNNSRVNTKLDLCMEKLGIEKKTYGNNNKGGGTSMFSGKNGNDKGRSFSQSSIDDINDL